MGYLCKHVVVLQQVSRKCDDTHLKVPTLGRQKQEGYEFRTSLVYTVSTNSARAHIAQTSLTTLGKGLGAQLSWECLPSMHEALLKMSTASDTSPQTYHSRRKGRRVRNLRSP